MNKFIKKCTLYCISLIAITCPLTASAIVIENFSATVFSQAPFIGNVYSGTLSYDETALTGLGDETLTPVNGDVSVDFTFEGQTFSETHDFDFNAFPELSFVNGFLSAIDYFLVDDTNGVDFNDSTVDSVSVSGDLIPFAGGFTTDAFVDLKPIIITENFIATVFGDAPFTGNELTGTFSYDSTALTGVGAESLTPSLGDVTIDFLFEGQAFDETNDIDFDGFPNLDFIDGNLSGIDYLIAGGINGVNFNNQIIQSLAISGPLSLSVDGFRTDAFISVPAPSTLALLVIGLASISHQHRKTQAKISLN